MEGKAKKIIEGVKDYLIITLGLLCYTAGWSVFILPNHLVGGGVSGISAILQYTTGFPVSYSFFIINVVLLLIALKVLGPSFGVKTVYAIFFASFSFKLLPMLIPDAFIQEVAIENGKLLCCIIGGAMSGLGIGLTFSRGGSTGGTDIIALMITKYHNIAPGRLILLFDVFIVGSSIFLTHEEGIGHRLANVMFGYILVAASGYTVDLFISGTKQSVQVIIFSKKYDEIADIIANKLRRGVTVLYSQGWYSKEDGKVLLVIVRKTESNALFKVVKEVDKDAFLSVASVTGVYGQGFDIIKTKK